MEIRDSGNRRSFDSGAVRDIAKGKGRCDLLPLGVANYVIDEITGEDCYGSFFLNRLEEYIYHGNDERLADAIKQFCLERNWDAFTALLEVAVHYEQGARKYAERNWEKGIPLHCYIDSAVRHYLKWRRGDTDEPHARAVIWNLLGAIWTARYMPQLNDLPSGSIDKEDDDADTD